MAYTRPWADVNNLPGTRDADEIDDASRETHTDLEERFADIVQDVTADPWVLKVPGTGVDQSYSIRIPAAGGMIVSGLQFDPALGSVKPLTAGGSGTWVCCIQVPRTLHVKGAIFTCFRAAPGIVTGKIVQIDGSSGATPTPPNVVAQDSAPGSLSVIQAIVVSGVDEIIGDTNDIYFQVDITGNGASVDDTQFYAVNINVIPS